MSWQIASALVILASPLAIGGYDLAAYWMAGSRATISRISLETALAHPGYKWSVCFLFGVLCGHLFAPTDAARQLPGWLSLVLFVLLPLLVAFGSLVLSLRTQPAAVPCQPAPYALVGVILFLALGALLGASYLPQTLED